MRPIRRVVPLALACLVAGGCVQRVVRATAPADSLPTVDRSAPFLKVHARDGSLFLLSSWTADDTARLVRGSGTRFTAARESVGTGEWAISLDSVVLFETNVARTAPSVGALAVVTGVTAGIAAACALNPKACFGSCPTFYASDGTRELLQAEGFSASIAPSLAATDVDALYRARPAGTELRLDVVNEAYETHVIEHADLLVVPRRGGHRVLRSDTGEFWSVSGALPPTRCTGAEGDCGELLHAFDGRERTSLADSTDLATREEVELEWETASERPALVIASRQSLLPTYLLYQAFAYLGRSTGTWLAAFERSDSTVATRARSLVAALGGIDVLAQRADGQWDSVATVLETGPLASDVRMVPLPDGTRRVRIRMARGAWRLDAVALAARDERVTPIRVQPQSVAGSDGNPAPDAHARLLDPARSLVTYPGDRFTLVYRLPAPGPSLELFLESRGYYLEWMRDDWVAEENPLKAAALFLDPAGSLRRLAPAFKREEPSLEASFWSSRYVTP